MELLIQRRHTTGEIAELFEVARSSVYRAGHRAGADTRLLAADSTPVQR